MEKPTRIEELKAPNQGKGYFFDQECPDNVALDILFDPQNVPLSNLLWALEGKNPSWIADQDIALIEAIENQLTHVVGASRAETTLHQYARQYDFMRSQGERPEEVSNNLKSYYTYRAAHVWGLAREASFVLEKLGDALTTNDEDLWHDGVDALTRILNEFDCYPPCSEGQDSFSGVCRFTKKNGQKKHHESKRKHARKLPVNWRDDIWNAISDRTKNKAAVALLMTVAPRPAELEGGVTVVADGNAILIGIEGAKVIEGKRGQKIRGIRVDVLSPEAHFLLALAKSKGGEAVIKASSVSGLNKLLVRTGRRVLGKKVTLSAYDYRHALASDLKAEGRSQEVIAITLGHQSSRTQAGYGQAQQSRGSRNPIVSVIGSEPVRIHQRSFEFASVLRSDPTPFSNC